MRGELTLLPEKKLPPTAVCIAATLDAAPKSTWRKLLHNLVARPHTHTVVVTPSSNLTFPAEPRSGVLTHLEARMPAPTGKRASASAWAEAALRMLGQCWSFLEEFEKRLPEQGRYATFVVARVDAAWMPGTSLTWLLHRVQSYHTSLGQMKGGAAGRIVFTPDTETFDGVNDRLAIMGRYAARTYMGTQRRLLFSQRNQPVGNGTSAAANASRSEVVLGDVLRKLRVRVKTFPTLAAMRCCSRARSLCRDSACLRLCTAGASVDVRYAREAEAAAAHAAALRAGRARFVRCSVGLCLHPHVALPWEPEWRRAHGDEGAEYSFCRSNL